MSVWINGCKRSALVDTGCTQTLVRKACCNAWEKKVPVLTVGGGSLVCCGESVVDGPPVAVQALVVDGELLGYDLLLGMYSITQLGGITVNETGNIRFSRCEKRVCAAITLDEADFHAEYDRDTNAWTASWKWSGNQPRISLRNWLSEYPPPAWLREQYEEELQAWIDSGWLRPYPSDELGPPRGLIPLMAVLQESKQKVRPVMDYCELNKHVNPYTAGADICAHKLREWRQQGSDVAVLDLRRAYLQIRVEKSLWPFQTVEIKGTRYCLTRLGFGLNMAPSIMTAIRQQDEAMRRQHRPTSTISLWMRASCLPRRLKSTLRALGWRARSRSICGMGHKCLACAWAVARRDSAEGEVATSPGGGSVQHHTSEHFLCLRRSWWATTLCVVGSGWRWRL